MRVSKVWKGCVVAFGAAAAVAVACGTFTQASAAETEYKIYPTPHEVTYDQGVVDFEGTVNTIVGDGIDGYTEDRLDEVLELVGVTATPAEATSDDGEGIEILVGIEGSGDAADTYVTEGPSADLFTKTDAYYLAVETRRTASWSWARTPTPPSTASPPSTRSSSRTPTATFPLSP